MTDISCLCLRPSKMCCLLPPSLLQEIYDRFPFLRCNWLSLLFVGHAFRAHRIVAGALFILVFPLARVRLTNVAVGNLTSLSNARDILFYPSMIDRYATQDPFLKTPHKETAIVQDFARASPFIRLLLHLLTWPQFGAHNMQFGNKNALLCERRHGKAS